MKELEAKYLLVERVDQRDSKAQKPGKLLRRILQDLVWAGYLAAPKGTRLIHDVYYDTSDKRLQRAGWSLRCRRHGGRKLLTCKQITRSDQSLFERREVEQTTMSDTPTVSELGDGPVRDLLRRYVPDQHPLLPLFTLHNRRQAYRVHHTGYPRSEIELVMDRVHIPTSAAASSENEEEEKEEEMRFVEFEAELKQGPVAVLDDLVAVLRSQQALRCSRASKFQRGLMTTDATQALSGGVPKKPISLSSSVSRLGVKHLHEQLQTFRSYESFAYEGIHPEAVHQMRIATRRIRSCLNAFGDFLGDGGGDGGDESSVTLTRDVRWLCDVLGRVRDLDVHLQHVVGYRESLKDSNIKALYRYEQHLLSKQQSAQRCLMRALDDRRYTDMLSHYQTYLSAAASAPEKNAPSISSFAQGYIPERIRLTLKAGRKIDRKSKAKELHRLRIRVKRLRYQLELLSEPYGRPLQKASKRLRKLQDTLGAHQDACVAQSVLREYRQQLRAKSDRRCFAELVSFEADRAAALRKRFHRDWLKFDYDAGKLKRVF